MSWSSLSCNYALYANITLLIDRGSPSSGVAIGAVRTIDRCPPRVPPPQQHYQSHDKLHDTLLPSLNSHPPLLLQLPPHQHPPPVPDCRTKKTRSSVKRGLSSLHKTHWYLPPLQHSPNNKPHLLHGSHSKAHCLNSETGLLVSCLKLSPLSPPP